jgi:hypothetical protein
LTDLFGADQVNKLFKFASDDPKAAVTGTTASSTRQALVERSSKLTEELGKIAGAKTEAMGVKEKEFTTAEKQIFGDVNSGGGINTFKTVFNNMTNNANNVRSKINDITSSMFSREWKGISRDSSIADIISSESQKMQAELNKRAIQIEEARKQKNTALMKSLYDSYTNYSRQKQKELNDLWNSMSENARRL